MLKNQQEKKISKENLKETSVSIITITQKKRFECIGILVDIIKTQTYNNIIEWIIVEGSQNQNDVIENKSNIENFIKNIQPTIKFKIIYIKKEKEAKLGELRNIGNNKCSGDIIVCMDDDDFYFPNRVEHAVKKLLESKFKIAGCSNHLVYDYDFDKIIQMQFKNFGPYHSINSCMAWKKEYLKINSHDPNATNAEESSFTKNFTEPMIQLDPYSTAIISSHSSNTFLKKIFFIQIYNDIYNLGIKVNHKINKFIPEIYLEKFKKIFLNKKDEINYDIVYMCGAISITWDPSDGKLGGSEQAVVNLSENWVKLGKSVIVYGEVPDKILNGVIYKPWQQFNFNSQYKNLILWRNYGMVTVCPFNVKADMTFIDLHDNFTGGNNDILKKYYRHANKIFVKSNYHKECFLNHIDSNYDQSNIIILPNGIRTEKFSICPTNIQRNPYRFCYCSCYTRGLDKLICIVWPIIYGYEPRAELHVYYGMDGISDENYKNYLRSLLAQPGVMDHGRQPIDLIIREKYMSTFHFYITNTEAEIDCISIRESIVTGCLPLLSNFGVFKERTGFHYDFNNEKEFKMVGVQICNLLKNPNLIREKIETFRDDKTIVNWNQIASEWLNNML